MQWLAHPIGEDEARPTRALAVRLQGLNPFGLLGERTAFGILARVGPPGEPPTTAQEQSQYRIPKQSFDSLCASPQAKGAIGPVRKSVERRLRMSDRAAERAFCRFVSRSFRRLSNSGVGRANDRPRPDFAAWHRHARAGPRSAPAADAFISRCDCARAPPINRTLSIKLNPASFECVGAFLTGVGT
jgi:hypothetical protein